jgi:PAS domain S-box-containing protein
LKTNIENKQFKTTGWRIPTAAGILGAFSLLIVSYGFYSGNRINTVDAPLVRAAMKIKLEAATTEILIETLMDGGQVSGQGTVWDPVDRAIQDFRTRLEKGLQDRFWIPFVKAPLREIKVETLEQNLSELKSLTRQRMLQTQRLLLSDPIDTVYRARFNDFMTMAGRIEKKLGQAMADNLTRFRTSQGFLIALCALLALVTAVLLHRFDRRREKAYQELQQTGEYLKEEIIERRRNEKKVLASEERFRQLAENIMDLFWLEQVQEPCGIIYLSPAFEKWLGRRPEAVYAESEQLWDAVHPLDKNRVMLCYEDFIQDRAPFDTCFRVTRSDAAIRWVRARGFPIRDEEGRLIRVAGLAQDITAQKNEEAHQAQMFQELKDFSYTVSHDLRAPLIGIKGFCDEIGLCLDELKPWIQQISKQTALEENTRAAAVLHEELPEAVHFIKAAVSRMNRLLDGILRLSRFGRRELLLEQLDVKTLVEDILETLAFQIKSQNIAVTVSNLPHTFADKASLEQIFANLLNNAINYRDPQRPGRISVDGESHWDEDVYRVTDNGLGIAPDHIEKIFNLFERLDKDSTPGEGMGLTYVRVLVRRHGGNVWCESQPGAGSTFSFTILKKLMSGGEHDGAEK